MFSILVSHQHCEYPLCTTQSLLLSFIILSTLLFMTLIAILLFKGEKHIPSAILVAAVAHHQFRRIRHRHGPSKYAPCPKTEAQQWHRKDSFFQVFPRLERLD